MVDIGVLYCTVVPPLPWLSPCQSRIRWLAQKRYSTPIPHGCTPSTIGALAPSAIGVLMPSAIGVLTPSAITDAFCDKGSSFRRKLLSLTDAASQLNEVLNIVSLFVVCDVLRYRAIYS